MMSWPGLAVILIATAFLAPACTSDTTAGEESIGYAGNPDEADQTIEVETLDTMAFEPSNIEVSAGETVTFQVINPGMLPHEFLIGDEQMQEAHKEDMASHGDAPHDHPNSAWVEPGETKEVTWAFPTEGSVLYGCHLPGHYEAGMVGRIDAVR